MYAYMQVDKYELCVSQLLHPRMSLHEILHLDAVMYLMRERAYAYCIKIHV